MYIKNRKEEEKMVYHIVMWKFKPEIEESKKAGLKKEMKEKLTALVGKVPGLLSA